MTLSYLISLFRLLEEDLYFLPFMESTWNMQSRKTNILALPYSKLWNLFCLQQCWLQQLKESDQLHLGLWTVKSAETRKRNMLENEQSLFVYLIGQICNTYHMIVSTSSSKNVSNCSLSPFNICNKLKNNSIVLLYFINQAQIYGYL